MNELVSIIMPSYNTAKYIKEALDSVVSQTYQNWELIIVDDCSTDNTDEVVSLFLNDQRIRYLKSKINRGAALARNRALSEAKGKWIAFLDSDDMWMPDKLEKQVRFMENNNYHFTYTNYIEIDERSKPNGKMVTGPKRIKKAGMYDYCWPGCLTVMYDVEKVGLIQIVDIRKNNDYAMWLQVCKKENCYLLDEVLAAYRRGRSGSISTQSYKKLILGHYKLFREADKRGVLTSGIYTVRNLFWGFYKKQKFVIER